MQYMIQQEMYIHQEVNWIHWVFKQNLPEFVNINTFNFLFPSQTHVSAAENPQDITLQTLLMSIERIEKKQTNTVTAQGFCCSWREHIQLLNSLVIMQLWCRMHQHIWKDYWTLMSKGSQGRKNSVYHESVLLKSVFLQLAVANLKKIGFWKIILHVNMWNLQSATWSTGIQRLKRDCRKQEL